MQKLIIAGGRNYRFTKEDIELLDGKAIGEVVSGGAKGADAEGEAWARSRDIPVVRFDADWGRYGRGAGPVRNRKMAEYADEVILFPGGRGTESMAREARRAGIKVTERRGTPE
jgi:hypothetical protein